MKKLLVGILTLIVFITNAYSQYYGQENKPQGSGTIKGKVLDDEIGSPVEYANLVIFKMRDSSMVSGTITKPDGSFLMKDVPFGMYYIKIRFIGYNEKIINRVMVNPRKPDVDLGNIQLSKYTEQLEGVEITAERPRIEYKIDKKVVHVDQDLVSVGGSAADVLENTPSVKVDLEGNVSLRGSSNFTVLIDGKPTILDPSDVLQQIPASTIENIEVITNPSAKYDPDGTAGIINVITKKSKLTGISGMINASVGTNNKYGLDLLLNYRNDKMNVYIGGRYNDHNGKGSSINNTETLVNDTTTFNYSDGSRNGGRFGYSVKTGVDLFLNDKNTLSIAAEKQNRGHERIGEYEYEIWTIPSAIDYDYTSENSFKRVSDGYSFNMDYQKKFIKPGHQLSASFNYHYEDQDEDNYTSTNTLNGFILTGQTNTEDGIENEYRFKLDYTLPVTEKNKFEAGFQSRLEYQSEDYEIDHFDTISDLWINDPIFAVNTDYHRNIHAAYAIYSGEYKKLGYQFGMRGEYTDRLLENSDTNINFSIDRFDLFPTIHFSYQLPAKQQILLSYSRRIERPRGYYLEPFYTWMDAYNVRIGNPDIKPEYINSMELSYQKRIKTSFVAIEAYYRQTTNHITRIRSVYDQNIFLHTFANVGQEESTGIELMLNLNLTKWLNINTSFDYYNYQLKGTLFDNSVDAESNDWSLRMNTTFKIHSTTRFQINGRYSSPSITVQGEREENYSMNLGLRKDFYNKKLSATIQFRDIFGTGKYEFTSFGKDFSSYTKFTRETQILMLTLSYKINNYQRKREERKGNNGGMEYEEEF